MRITYAGESISSVSWPARAREISFRVAAISSWVTTSIVHRTLVDICKTQQYNSLHEQRCQFSWMAGYGDSVQYTVATTKMNAGKEYNTM